MLPLNNELESCWCKKLTEHIKIISQLKFERKRIKGDILWHFEFSTIESSKICIGHQVGGHALARQHGIQNYFLLISCQTFDSYTQMCCKRYHIIFSTFSFKFKCKICVQKEVIRNFKNHILVTRPPTNWFILRKWCGLEKPNHYYFV